MSEGLRLAWWVFRTATQKEALVAQHPNARLTPAGRQILVDRITAGRPVAHVADMMGISRQTAYRWWRRYRRLGTAGLHDRPSVPYRTPHRTPAHLEQRVVALRREHGWSPAVIAHHTGVAASTCWRILRRHGISRMRDLDPPTRRRIRRYERDRAGSLVHVDIKKLGRVPTGGGWRVHGAANRGTKQKVGYEHVHAAVDDHSRLAYAEALPADDGATCAAFWRRAAAFFAHHGIHVEQVMTDNALAYTRSRAFAQSLTETGVTRHVRIRPYRPQTNGKVERFNLSLKREWAYARTYTDNPTRSHALDHWLHHYNHHRYHHAIGDSPITRVTNTAGCDT